MGSLLLAELLGACLSVLLLLLLLSVELTAVKCGSLKFMFVILILQFCVMHLF